MWSKLPPRQPCYAIFKGWRNTNRPGTVELLHEPIQVVEYFFPNGGKELAVVMTGRATRWPITKFEGEWQVLDLEAA